jgi:glycosyltransferase involved in cell wall biosynthesis
MNMPRVSVVIPLFDLKQYVGEAIDSVLQQTYPNIEIIVVDDGSTDNPETVLSDYRDHIKLITQENKGLASARNTGIRNSEGEYLVFLDADDYISPEKIEVEVEVLEKHSATGWVYENSLAFDEDGQFIRRIPQDFLLPNEDPPQGMVFQRLILTNFMTVNSVMIRKTTLLAVGTFDESLRGGFEDWDLWLRISPKNEVRYIDEDLAFVRIRTGSLSSQINAIPFLLAKLRVIKKICQQYPDLTHSLRDGIMIMVAQTHFRLGTEYFNKGRFGESSFEFARSIKSCPFQKRAYFWLIWSVLKTLRIPGV